MDIALLQCEQRHPFLRYQGLEYTYADIEDFETRLTRIYRREVHMVQGCHGAAALEMELAGLEAVFISGGLGISSARDFLGIAPSYTMIRDPILRLCHRYLKLFAAGRKSRAHIFGGQFVARLAEHFGLLTVEILGGLMVIAPELPIIERQPDAVVGAPGVAQDVPVIDEGGQADPAPILYYGLPLATHGGQGRTHNSQTHDPPILIFYIYRIKPGSKFSIIVHEYVTEPSRIFTPKCRIEKREMISRPWKQRNIDEHWWRLYKSGDLEVLES
ncbi:hypothetical protein Tco_1206276 [Tanacetum coccineum]